MNYFHNWGIYCKIHQGLDSHGFSNLTEETVSPMICLCAHLVYLNSEISLAWIVLSVFAFRGISGHWMEVNQHFSTALLVIEKYFEQGC